MSHDAEECLHCRLVDVINDHGGAQLSDLNECLSALGRIAGELIAAHPDRRKRDDYCAAFRTLVAATMIRARASGSHPEFSETVLQ